MLEYKHTEAYRSIKAPLSLKSKVFSNNSRKKTFNYKVLISLAACVIIMAVIPTYLAFTNPTVSVSDSFPVAARYIGVQIPLEIDLDRASTVTVSHGTLDSYNGKTIKGRVDFIWSFQAEESETPTLTVKDVFKTTVYSLSYNENNGSWSIIKN